MSLRLSLSLSLAIDNALGKINIARKGEKKEKENRSEGIFLASYYMGLCEGKQYWWEKLDRAKVQVGMGTIGRAVETPSTCGSEKDGRRESQMEMDPSKLQIRWCVQKWRENVPTLTATKLRRHNLRKIGT